MNKKLGNVSVPGAVFVCALAREPNTQREQYVIQISSRWGINFELALFNRDQMLSVMDGTEESNLERAFNQSFCPDSYELINVYKLYNESEEVELRDSVLYDESVISDAMSSGTIGPSDSLS